MRVYHHNVLDYGQTVKNTQIWIALVYLKFKEERSKNIFY